MQTSNKCLNICKWVEVVGINKDGFFTFPAVCESSMSVKENPKQKTFYVQTRVIF